MLQSPAPQANQSKFVTVTLADGSTFRKGKQTKGFRVIKAEKKSP
jgi:hypothetical protein